MTTTYCQIKHGGSVGICNLTRNQAPGLGVTKLQYRQTMIWDPVLIGQNNAWKV